MSNAKAQLAPTSYYQLHTSPFLKWAGGKTRLLPKIQSLLPPDYRALRHIEPFLGGGALFFAMAPRDAILTDTNPDLINAYRHVAFHPEQLCEELTWLKAEHSKGAYYEVRELFNSERHRIGSLLERPNFNRATPSGSVLRAAVFIYLNKTCFNGLYRENKAGEFNVPMGDFANPGIFDPQVILRCSETLRGAPREPSLFRSPGVRMGCMDFRHTCRNAEEGDFVYLDPPYDAIHDNKGGFVQYNADGFSEEDQRDLALRCAGMHERGAKFLLSNHDTPLIRELYADFLIESITAPRSIGATTRESAPEVLIRNYVEISEGFVEK